MHKINYLAIGGLVGVTAVSGAVLSMTRAKATDGTASDTKSSTASVTVSESCSMTANVSTPHSATLPGGTYSVTYSDGGETPYSQGIGETEIQTFCNDPSGYAIYAVGYTGNTVGSNVLSSDSLSSTYDIATGTATSGNVSGWSMKLAKEEDSTKSYMPNRLSILSDTEGSFSSYHTVPGSYAKVASFSSATDTTLGSKLTMTYAAYISYAQPAGTYTGQVKYTLVHPSGDDIADADTMQRVALWGGELAIGEEVTVRDARDDKEYTVGRVCTNYSGDDCTASELWMTQNLDLDIGVTGTAALTSVNTDLNSAYDKEGNLFKDYAVNDTTGVISWTPTSANTTNSTLVGSPATISNFAYGVTGQVTGWTNKDNNPYMAQGTLSGEEVYELPTSATTGATSTYDTISVGLSTCVTDARTANPALTEAEARKICKHYKIGNYYNFAAANATSFIPTSYQVKYAEMPNSICPKGWRLPRGLGDENGDGTADRMTDFNKLLIAQGVTDATDLVGGVSKSYASNGFKRIQTTGKNGDPLYFARSGYVHGSNLNNSSYGGYYWSSTVQSSSYGYNLYFNSGNVYPADQYYRLLGRSVRCVAR